MFTPHNSVDFVVLNQSYDTCTFYVLMSNNAVNSYEVKLLNQSIKINLLKENFIDVVVKNPQKLFLSSETNSNQLIQNRLFVTGSDIQSTLIKAENNTFLSLNEKEDFIITNYELLHGYIPSKIIKVAYFEKEGILSACAGNGFLYSWDISNFYEGKFLSSI